MPSFSPKLLVDTVSIIFTRKTNSIQKGGKPRSKAGFSYLLTEDMEGDFSNKTVYYDQKSYRTGLRETAFTEEDYDDDAGILDIEDSIFDSDAPEDSLNGYENDKTLVKEANEVNLDWDYVDEIMFESSSSSSETSFDEDQDPFQDKFAVTRSNHASVESVHHPWLDGADAVDEEVDIKEFDLDTEDVVVPTEAEFNHIANVQEMFALAESDEAFNEGLPNIEADNIDGTNINDGADVNGMAGINDAQPMDASYTILSDGNNNSDNGGSNSPIPALNWIEEWNSPHQHLLRERFGRSHPDYVKAEDVADISKYAVTNEMIFAVETIPDPSKDGEVMIFMKIGGSM